MISGSLATIFVDLVARDQLKPYLESTKANIGAVQKQFDELSKLRGTPALNVVAGFNAQLELMKTKASAAATLAEIDYTKSDPGKANIQAQVKSQQVLADAQKQLAREFDTAKYGKFGMVMKDLKGAVGGFKETLEKFAGGGAGILGPVIANIGLLASVAAASPAIFETFTGSVQYLAASIGRLLLPAIIDVSRWIQDAARWFLSLDEQTRNNISTAAKWAVGLLAVAGAIRLVSAALASMMAINPWLLGLAGLATLAALGGLFGTGIRDAMRESLGGSSVLALAGPSTAAGGTMASRVVAALPDMVERTSGAVSAGLAGEDARRVGGAIGVTALGPLGPLGTLLSRSGRTGEAVGGALGTTALLGPLGPLLSGVRGLGSSATAAPISGGIRGRAEARGGEGDLLSGAEFKSQFFNIEDQWRRLQQAGASVNPLEAERLRINNEAMGLLISHLRGGGSLDRITTAAEHGGLGR